MQNLLIQHRSEDFHRYPTTVLKKTRSHATVSWMAILSMGEHMVAAMNLLSNGQYPPKTTRLKCIGH